MSGEPTLTDEQRALYAQHFPDLPEAVIARNLQDRDARDQRRQEEAARCQDAREGRLPDTDCECGHLASVLRRVNDNDELGAPDHVCEATQRRVNDNDELRAPDHVCEATQRRACALLAIERHVCAHQLPGDGESGRLVITPEGRVLGSADPLRDSLLPLCPPDEGRPRTLFGLYAAGLVVSLTAALDWPFGVGGFGEVRMVLRQWVEQTPANDGEAKEIERRIEAARDAGLLLSLMDRARTEEGPFAGDLAMRGRPTVLASFGLPATPGTVRYVEHLLRDETPDDGDEPTYGLLVTTLCVVGHANAPVTSRAAAPEGVPCFPVTHSEITGMTQGVPGGLMGRVGETIRKHRDWWCKVAGGEAWDRRRHNAGKRRNDELHKLIDSYVREFPNKKDETREARDELYRAAGALRRDRDTLSVQCLVRAMLSQKRSQVRAG